MGKKKGKGKKKKGKKGKKGKKRSSIKWILPAERSALGDGAAWFWLDEESQQKQGPLTAMDIALQYRSSKNPQGPITGRTLVWSSGSMDGWVRLSQTALHGAVVQDRSQFNAERKAEEVEASFRRNVDEGLVIADAARVRCTCKENLMAALKKGKTFLDEAACAVHSLCVRSADAHREPAASYYDGGVFEGGMPTPEAKAHQDSMRRKVGAASTARDVAMAAVEPAEKTALTLEACEALIGQYTELLEERMDHIFPPPFQPEWDPYGGRQPIRGGGGGGGGARRGAAEAGGVDGELGELGVDGGGSCGDEDGDLLGEGEYDGVGVGGVGVGRGSGRPVFVTAKAARAMGQGMAEDTDAGEDTDYTVFNGDGRRHRQPQTADEGSDRDEDGDDEDDEDNEDEDEDGGAGDASDSVWTRPAVEAEAFLRRATLYAAVGRHDLALKDATRSVQLNPRYAPAYYRLGHALFQHGRSRDAAQAFRQGLSSCPGSRQFTDAFNVALSRRESRGEIVARRRQQMKNGPPPPPPPKAPVVVGNSQDAADATT